MNLSIFIPLLFCLQLFYYLVGRRSTKHVRGKEDYFLANRSVRFFPLMMTFLATQVGGGVVLGAAEEAYQFGWVVLLYPLGVALGLIWLGCGMGRRLSEFQVSTVAQLFELVYHSTFLRKVASTLSILSLFMILVAQIIASDKFLMSLGFHSPLLFSLFWAIVILYTAQGGIRAVISTDLVQAAFFSCVFLLCFGAAFFFPSSLPILQESSSESLTDLFPKLCGWLLMPLLFMVIEQDMGQRCLAGASSRTVSKAAFWAGVCTLGICAVPVFFGSLAASMGLEIPQGSSVLMTVVAKTTPDWVTALVGCAVLAAIVSTATSLINAISSNLSSDFKLSFLQKVEPMRAVQGVTCLISMTAICFAFYFNNVVDLLIQSYELSVSCLFVPILMALLRRQGHFISALLSIAMGSIGFFFFRIHPLEIPKEIISLLLSFLGFACGEGIAIYKKPN